MAKMDKLKKKMKQRGVTYSELSRKMDINRSTLYRKIAGNGEGFSVREAAYIGRALGLTILISRHLRHMMNFLQR